MDGSEFPPIFDKITMQIDKKTRQQKNFISGKFLCGFESNDEKCWQSVKHILKGTCNKS